MISEKLALHPPILKKFTLIGLNGYKSVGISLNSAAKIAAADNGAGKTSLLNAIYSVFVDRPALMYALDFDSVHIIWSDDTESNYKKNDLFGALNSASLEKMATHNFFSQWDVSKSDAIDLLTKYSIGDIDEATQTRAFRSIYRESPFDREEVLEHIESITGPVFERGSFHELHQKAKHFLEDCSILYLPTYRRIEADIPEYQNNTNNISHPRFRGRSRPQKDAWDSSQLIFFGMRDVENKLNSIVTQIREETLEAYSRTNGQTLEDLVENSEIASDSEEELDISSIEVVLSRVGKAGSLGDRLKSIIESREIYNENRRELRKFLRQLLRVYAQRRDDEQAISDFVNVVNGYFNPLMNEKDLGQGEKSLSFDKLKLLVAAKNNITGKTVKFGSLSSGEKQIVSIFARLILDPRRKYLVLVDEPELSLSLDWQQKLLPDIFNTANCKQLIAITHSPFIYDNSLATVAGSIEVSHFLPHVAEK